MPPKKGRKAKTDEVVETPKYELCNSGCFPISFPGVASAFMRHILMPPRMLK